MSDQQLLERIDDLERQDYLNKGGGKLSGDLEFTQDSKGVILLDRTSGDRYRLYVDGGVLLIELVP